MRIISICGEKNVNPLRLGADGIHRKYINDNHSHLQQESRTLENTCVAGPTKRTTIRSTPSHSHPAMNPVSPLPALAATVLAALCAFGLSRWQAEHNTPGRLASVDGLRGYLAFWVYLHHAAIWYFYLRTDQWRVPPSHLYTHFGEASVAVFFMVTGLLFFGKLRRARGQRIDWAQLYTGRLLRLGPLYALALCALLLTVAVQSDWQLRVEPLDLLTGLIRWASFTALGAPDLNGVRNTGLILAGVTWSLPYEWFFYFTLPLWAALMKVNVPRKQWAWGLVALLVFLVWRPQKVHLFAFAMGWMAAWALDAPRFVRWSQSAVATGVAVICTLSAVAYFSTAYKYACILLLGVSFCIVAAGNGLGGLLHWRASRTLGEMAYSIYLLHGVVLYGLFHWVLGLDAAAQLSPEAHWLWVLAAVPVLLGLSHLAFRLIERPAMQKAARGRSGQ